MKLSLEELNGSMWYRGMKVIYVIAYLVLFSIGYLVNPYDYNVPIMLPSSYKEAIQDDNFYLLSSSEMTSILSTIDSDFRGLPENEQQKVITFTKENKSKNAKGKANFIYFARTDFDVKKSIVFGLVYILSVIVSMECIRRCFYYVVIGRFFPRL